jgi:hypothetical protein
MGAARFMRLGSPSVSFLIGWAALTLGFPTLQAQRYEVEGHVTYWNFQNSRDRSSREPDVHFRLSVDGRRWFVHTTTDSKELYDYVEAAYDESWLYCVRNMMTAVRKNRNETGSAGANVATASIGRGEILHDPFAPTISPIWLAFASGAYFDRTTNGMAEPAIDYSAENFYSTRDPFRQMLRLTRHASFPKLPEEVTYFDDGFEHFRGSLQRRPPPYDAGFTNAIYQVLRWTNVGELALPAMSRLDIFAPKDAVHAPKHPGKTNTVLILQQRYLMSLTASRQNLTTAVFRPTLPGVTAVCDARFYDEVPVLQSYFASKDWLSAEAVTNSPGFKALARATARQAPR